MEWRTKTHAKILKRWTKDTHRKVEWRTKPPLYATMECVVLCFALFFFADVTHSLVGSRRLS